MINNAVSETLNTLDNIKEQLADLEFENRYMAKALEMLGFSQEQINTIAMCANMAPVENKLTDTRKEKWQERKEKLKKTCNFIEELEKHGRTTVVHRNKVYHVYRLMHGYTVEELFPVSEQAGVAVLEGDGLVEHVETAEETVDVIFEL